MQNRPEVRVDCYKIVDEYRKEGDIAKENANQNIGPSGLMGSVGMEGLRRVYLKEMQEAGHCELVDLHNKGAVHIHDLGLGAETPYCAGHSLSNVLSSGLRAIAVSSPATHIDSAFNHMVNYIASNSNDFSGAQAFNNVDVYIAPYAYKSYLDFKKAGCSPTIAFQLARKKVYQSIQNFIFHLNYDTRFGNQQPFSNITLAITVPPDMKDELALVGGKPLDTYYEYAIDGVRVNNHTYGDLHEWQRLVTDAFLDTYTAGDANGNGFTFPVLTLNVEEDFFGHPCINKICELTAKYGTPFFQNFIGGVSGGKKMSPQDTRAMCPLHPKELIPVKSKKHQYPILREIGAVYNRIQRGMEYEVLCNGEWKDISAIQVPINNPLTIEVSNGISINMDGDHLQPVKNGKGCSIETISARNLEVGMYVPFAKNAMPEEYDNYMAGYAVGTYIGDGSSQNGTLTYSLNNSTKIDVLDVLKNFYEGMGFQCSISKGKRNVVFLRIKSNNQAATCWMSQYINMETALNKSIKKTILKYGQKFLKGILDGWYATDGGNSGRIYTASVNLKEDFKWLCGILGIHYNVDNNGDTRDGRYGTNPVYTLKFHKKENYSDIFFTENDMRWFKITDIYKTELTEKAQYYYCLVVDSDNHLFQLGNGFITHNCRLNLDLNKLAAHTGGIFGNSDNTGSLQVVTISLPYLAKETENITTFYKRLDEIMELAKEEQLWKREQVDIAFDNGYFKLARQNFHRKFETFFTTIGFIGLWETVSMLLKDDQSFITEDGMKLAEDILTYMANKTNTWTETYNKLWNLEATPAESASYKLAKKALKQFPDIEHRGLKKAPYFTNSCHIPVEYQNDLSTVILTQNRLQTIPTGGTVTHFYNDEELSIEQVKEFIKTICQTKIPYFSLSMIYSICPICGYIPGIHETCPNEHTEEELQELMRLEPNRVVNE